MPCEPVDFLYFGGGRYQPLHNVRCSVERHCSRSPLPVTLYFGLDHMLLFSGNVFQVWERWVLSQAQDR